MVLDTSKHYPVLLNEIISIISPQHGGTFIDCTFGQGGYTKKILTFKNTKVIAIDRDIDSKKKADIISEKFSNRFLFKNKKFSQLEDLMKNRNYSIFNGHDHSFSTKIINDQIYTTLSTTGGSQNSSNSNVFDQITLISMRDRPYTTHLKLNEILNY